MWPALKELFKSAFSSEMPSGWRFTTVVICCATIVVLGFLYRDHILYFGPHGSAPQEIQYPVVNRERKSDLLADRSTSPKNRIEQGFEDISPKVVDLPEKNSPSENQSENQRYANVPMPRPRERRNYYRYYIEQGEGDPEVRRKTYECGRDGWPADCYLTTDEKRIEEARRILTKALNRSPGQDP